MFQSITFYVGEKTLGIYGEEFPLGTLTTEVLNITPEEYQALDGSLKSAIEGMARYAATRSCFVTVVVCCSSGFGGMIITRGFSSVIPNRPFR